MILTSTNSIQGKEIKNYLGIESENIYVYLYSTMGLSFKESLRVRKACKNGYENIEVTKKEIFSKLEVKAKILRANAVVGITRYVEKVYEASTLGISVMGAYVTYKK